MVDLFLDLTEVHAATAIAGLTEMCLASTVGALLVAKIMDCLDKETPLN